MFPGGGALLTTWHDSNPMTTKIQTGAERLIRFLESVGVEYIFGLSGGAAMPLFDALVDSKIRLVLTRHEQGATHMADGYARATGKPGVVLVTSGPGATNTVTGLLTAFMDSVPMLVLAGQTPSFNLGKDTFQEADVTGITYPVVKHSYLITDVNRLPEVMREAWHVLTTGRPGPVLLDLPKDVTSAPCPAADAPAPSIPGYIVPAEPDPGCIEAAAAALAKSTRPLLYVGHGAVISGAGPAIAALARKLQAPLVNTLLGKGAVDETDPLHLGMFGMHGNAYANKAVEACDLLMSIGGRWDDRIAGDGRTFCQHAVRIHIDIDQAEFNKTITSHIQILGDAKAAIEALLQRVQPLETAPWLEQCNSWRKQFPLRYPDPSDGQLRAQHVLDRLNHLTAGRAIITTDVGQHQMWAAQFCLTRENRMWLSSGGAGTMGFGFPSAIGAQFARPDTPVWAVVGDGGFQMTLCELATATIHKLPVKVLIINNNYLGMVRQWQELFFDNRLSGVDLEGNPDFVRLAEAYGAKALRISHPDEIDGVLQAAIDHNDGPCVVEASVVKEDNVFPMIPAGAPYSAMLIERPTTKLDKPKGST